MSTYNDILREVNDLRKERDSLGAALDSRYEQCISLEDSLAMAKYTAERRADVIEKYKKENARLTNLVGSYERDLIMIARYKELIASHDRIKSSADNQLAMYKELVEFQRQKIGVLEEDKQLLAAASEKILLDSRRSGPPRAAPRLPGASPSPEDLLSSIYSPAPSPPKIKRARTASSAQRGSGSGSGSGSGLDNCTCDGDETIPCFVCLVRPL
jgi:hypothetical protein